LILEGVGTALLIPPVYILTTMLFDDLTSRARAFGVISGMGSIGAAAGPLIGGLITWAISWRAAFVFQALMVVAIVFLSRRIKDPVPPDPTRVPDTAGAVLSAVGLVLVVMGILAADDNGWLRLALIAAGAVVLVFSFVHIRKREREDKEPLLSTELFRNRTSNLGLVTQNIQWLLLMRTSFVFSAFLQVVRGYNAIQNGVIFTAATLGILVSSPAAERLAKRYPQRTLILTGFVTTIVGVLVLLALVKGSPGAWAFAPGLLLISLGLGVMLTPSVNVVQSAFPEEQQGEISGLLRCVFNLGSSLGTAVAGTILVAELTSPDRAYALAMITLAVIAIIGLVPTMLLPAQPCARRRGDQGERCSERCGAGPGREVGQSPGFWRAANLTFYGATRSA
jgi:MFS family permease